MARAVFRCQLGDAMVLKRLIQAVREIVVEANFDCTANGLQVQVFHPSTGKLTIVLLPKDAHQDFDCISRADSDLTGESKNDLGRGVASACF